MAIWKLISVMVALSLVALGVLMPSWNFASAGLYMGLWIVFGGAFVYLFSPKHGRPALRIAAGVLGIGMTWAAIDFVIQQHQASGSFFQLRSPIVGFLVIGVPALYFAACGRSKHVDAHEQKKNDSD